MSTNAQKNPVLFFLQQSWLLMAAAVLFGALLASLNYAWQPRIQQNEIDKFNRLAGGLLTDAATFEKAVEALPVDLGKGKTYAVDVQQARNAAGEPAGWAFVCEGSGFADKIKLVVAVDAAFEKLAGFGVLSSNETPGFGDKISIKDGFYQRQFQGAPVTELTLTKLGDADAIDGEIVAISGATVTSKAVVDIFNRFLIPVRQALQEQGLLQ